MIETINAPEEMMNVIQDSSNCFCHFSFSSGFSCIPSSEPIHITSEVIITTNIRKSTQLIYTPHMWQNSIPVFRIVFRFPLLKKFLEVTVDDS